MKYRILSICDGTAQTYHRGLQPVVHCQEALAQDGIVLNADKYTSGYDAYIFHRRWFDMAIPMGLKAQDKKIVWELDDDIWNLPSWNPAWMTYQDNPCAWFLANADEIVVSTETLGGVVGDHLTEPIPITVLPNLIDLTKFQVPFLPQSDRKELRILWSGSAFHEPDLEMVAEVYRRLLSRYQDIICLFQGSWPTSLGEWVRIPGSNTGVLRPLSSRVGFIEPVAYTYHPKLLSDIAPDISLAVIANEQFALAKSNLKVLEAHAVGSACVASDLAPYRDTCAMLGSTIDNLVSACARLIEDVDLRISCGARGRREVETSWSWQHSSASWLNFFRNLAK